MRSKWPYQYDKQSLLIDWLIFDLVFYVGIWIQHKYSFCFTVWLRHTAGVELCIIRSDVCLFLQALLHPPVPAELTLCTATWLQAPGAAPQSTTLNPGCKTRNRSSISSSLKALLHRKLCTCDALTYGSLKCRFSQRCSAGVFPFSLLWGDFFIKHKDTWRHLLCWSKHHILLFTVATCGPLRLREMQLPIGRSGSLCAVLMFPFVDNQLEFLLVHSLLT